MDYNIFIHSVDVSGSQSPTKPWANTDSQTKPWAIGDNDAEVSQVITSPDDLATRGNTTHNKALSAIATAIVVANTAMSIRNTARQFEVASSGDYRSSILYANFQNALNWITHPFSSVINWQKAEQAIRIEDNRRAKALELTGDSRLNSLYGRGV